MGKYLEKLIGISGAPLGQTPPKINTDIIKSAGLLAIEIENLLMRKNGFYVFESALHVFSSESFNGEIGLNEWNKPDLWINEYQGIAFDKFFFAEDVFGGQFCVNQDKVFVFDAETGNLEFIGSNLEEWAQSIIRDYELLTGYPLAHQWQQTYGPIPPGMRLIPKTPFVLGGSFSLENLRLLDAVEGMLWRGHIAKQIKDLPDGATIKLNFE